MSRIQQVLHSAEALEGDKTATAALRQATSGQRQVSNKKPLSAVTGDLITCPGCDTVREERRSSWIRRLRLMFGLPAYRCRFCHRRFTDEEANQTQLVAKHRVELLSMFLRPEDDRGFDDLVGKIAQTERDQNLRSAALLKHETGERRKPERWLPDNTAE